jgi:EpsI family protein
VLKADTSTLRRYGNPAGGSVWLFVAYFSSQKYGSQMHSPKHCLPGGGWRIDRQEKFTLSLSEGRTPIINRLLIKEGDRTELMLYWFVTRSGLLHSEFAVKWHLMVNALRFRPTDAAFVRVTLPVEYGDVEAATAEATAFLNCFYDDINRALPFEN